MLGRIWVLLGLLAAMPWEARADLLKLAHGAEMIVDFSVRNYGYNNPGVSPYPTFLELELAALAPPASTLKAIPGSTGEHYSGILLQGWIQSLDGSASMPLLDGDAVRLGLPGGSLTATSDYSGAAIIYAEAALSLNLSESIFGPNREAEFVIVNRGADLTIGMGPGYSVRNAISEPMVTGAGFVQTAGITENVSMVSAPEPATWATVFSVCLALSLVGLRLARRTRQRALIPSEERPRT